MEVWRVCSPVIADTHHLDAEQDPDSRIRIEMKSWIRIRIKVKTWVRIRIPIQVMRIRSETPAYLSMQDVRDV
jgi:hypothetical protein